MAGHYFFYATETYIMHFLEAPQFLNARDLARYKINVGHKVNAGRKVYFRPRCGSLHPAVGVLALKQFCSHLQKITTEPVFFLFFLYGTCPL